MTDPAREALESIREITEEAWHVRTNDSRLTEIRGLACAALAQPADSVARFSEPVVLPDGSAFATASFPLPADHWLYAPRGEWDSERDEYAECPLPILTNAQREAVIAAARYAIRGATMCGQEPDFDPDALALNFAYALCGPAGGAVLPADAAPPAPQPAGRALTDEQIDHIRSRQECWEHVGERIEFRHRPFARAIERAHGIKSEGE